MLIFEDKQLLSTTQDLHLKRILAVEDIDSSEIDNSKNIKRHAVNDTNRRVSVEDKRIINCKTDVNQLVPLNINGRGINIFLLVPIIGCRKKLI